MAHRNRPLLIHIAAAHENRGRVVLSARTGAPHAAALDAAFRMARAFDAWVECLLIACPDLTTLSAHTFARGVTHAGRIAPLCDFGIADLQDAEIAAARRTVVTAATRADITLTTTLTRTAHVTALAAACDQQGPWNLVALADPVKAGDGGWLHDLLGAITGTAGIFCMGPAASSHATGSILLIAEDIDRVPQMLRAAERIALVGDTASARAILVLPAGSTVDETAELEGHLRLMLGELMAELPDDAAAPVSLADASVGYGTTAEIAETVRRLDCSLVIARTGGIAVPADSGSTSLLAHLACPLLLVR